MFLIFRGYTFSVQCRAGEWRELDPGSQLAPELTNMSVRYTAAKRALLANTSLQDDVKTHMLSSLVAGTVATTICAPADVLKSRVQAASKAGAGSSVCSLPSSRHFRPPWNHGIMHEMQLD